MAKSAWQGHNARDDARPEQGGGETQPYVAVIGLGVVVLLFLAFCLGTLVLNWRFL